MRNYDLISSLFWLAGGVLIIFGSLRLLIGGITNPGPGFFPLILGCLIGVTSVVLFISAVKDRPTEKKPFWADRNKWHIVVGTLLCLLIYTAVLPRIGFLMTTFLLLTFLFKVVGELNWKISLGAALLSALVFYALFQRVLNVEFPLGVLGI
jgi:putative tricarboxylic transport membrane protein